MKMCNACGETKAYFEFDRNSEVHDGYRYTCKICRRKNVPTNPEFTRLSRKRQDKTIRVSYGSRRSKSGGTGWSEVKRYSKYGITKAQFNQMVADQDSCCAICAKPLGEKFCIDHCHVTGKMRGLLCGKCNTGIGFLNDDPALLTAALAYLTA